MGLISGALCARRPEGRFGLVIRVSGNHRPRIGFAALKDDFGQARQIVHYVGVGYEPFGGSESGPHRGQLKARVIEILRLGNCGSGHCKPP